MGVRWDGCVPQRNRRRHSISSDDSDLVWTPWSDDERKAVILYIDVDHDGAYDGTCSGTLVDRRWVLTAGHCLVENPDLPSTPLASGRVAACSFANSHANAQCSPGMLIQLGPDYLSAPGPTTDFGLLKLEYELNPYMDLGFRAISSASTATIEAAEVFVDGTPGRKASGTSHCSTNTHSSPQVTSVTSSLDTYAVTWSQYGRQDSTSNTQVTSALITNGMDLGKGWSGGGYWYVSGGGGDYVVGVHAAFTTFIDWGTTTDGEFSGPKHDVFRAWVNATI